MVTVFRPSSMNIPESSPRLAAVRLRTAFTRETTSRIENGLEM